MGRFLHDAAEPNRAPGWGRKPPSSGHRHGILVYPEADGVPLGETESHILAILHLFSALRFHLQGRPGTYVGADLLLYYEEGDPTQVVVPDVFVAEGVKPGRRRTWKVWEEQASPRVVIEVTSKRSRVEDLGAKKLLYEDLGVEEYFVFDPLGEYLVPRLQGFRREAEHLVPMPATDTGELTSSLLAVDLVPEDDLLRIRSHATHALVPTMEEALEDRRRAEVAEAELAAVRAELEALRRRR